MMSIRIISFFCILLTISIHAKAQDTATARYTLIDIIKDSGVVLIRNYQSAELKMFKPEALEFAELKIGDTVEVTMSLRQVKRIKNRARRYPLLEPVLGSACCEFIGQEPADTELVFIATNKDGTRFRFQATDSLAKRIPPGFQIFTSPTHGYAMVPIPLDSDSSRRVVYAFPILAAKTD